MMTEAYPLQWPQSWPRTEYPKRAQFGTPFGRARDQLLKELRLLGATGVVISSNFVLRRDGLPYADSREPADKGVAVYFTLNGEQQCVPCDKWSTVKDNLQAVRKTIEALRGLERWGAKEMVNAAFRGFKALPESVIVTPQTVRPWHEVLEVSPNASIEVIKAAHKQMLHKHHPDKGGDDHAFMEVQTAYKQALEAVR
jgi:DnaJ-domain-containing protein 1